MPNTSDLDRILLGMDRLGNVLLVPLDKLVALLTVLPKDRITFALTLKQEPKQVRTLPDQTGFSNTKLAIRAFIGMKDPDNAEGPPIPDPNRVLTVASSDEAQVGIEHDTADQYTHFITTPQAESGTAKITITGDRNVEPVEFNFNYVPPVLDQINVQIGGLVPDDESQPASRSTRSARGPGRGGVGD